MAITGSLTPQQLQFFQNQGYLVIESFANPDEIKGMRNQMDELLNGFDCSTVSIFSTKNQKSTTDNHFYDSADKISFFFEEKAFDDEGKLKNPKELSINKVGHALHEHDPVFKRFCQSEEISSLLVSLGYKRPILMQSMYIFKQPGIGGEVVPHQDNSFLYTEPSSCTGLWLALEDATTLNGCLWAIPGSHKNGLVRRFIRDEEGVHFDRPSPNYDHKEFEAIEVKAGSLVVIHGDLIHQSFENQSPKSRHALSLHVVDTESCVWAPENWPGCMDSMAMKAMKSWDDLCFTSSAIHKLFELYFKNNRFLTEERLVLVLGFINEEVDRFAESFMSEHIPN